MRDLSISAAWDETKAILARDGRLLMTVALALIVLPQTIVAVVAPGMGGSASLATRLLLLADIVIGFAAQIAINRLAIGPSVTVRDAIARGFVRLLPVIAALLLVSIVLGVLMMLIATLLAAGGLIVVPNPANPISAGLVLLLLVMTAFVAAIFQLTVPIAAAEPGGPIHLLRRAWQLSRHHYFRLLAFFCIVFLGIILVLLAGQFVIGSVVVLLLGKPEAGSLSALVFGLVVASIQAAFTVVSAVMLARIYLQLAGRGEAQASVPSSGI